jgi:Fic family protein
MKALYWGVQAIKSPTGLPLSLRLLRDCHSILMTDVRGGSQNKTPGDFRTSQNWIGGTTPRNAIYVPPTVEEMDGLLGEMEKYIYKGNLPELVKVALLHYQFETIHPFLDGNGRIGRLFIILYLIDKNILTNPTLYISLFLKKRKGDYYDLLTDVRNRSNYENWIRFFLQGVVETSNQVMKTTKNIQALQEIDRANLKSQNEIKLLDLLFQQPVVQIKTVEEYLECSNQTANSLVKKFVEKEILKPVDNKQRYKKYRYDKYIKVIQEEL